MKIVDDEQLSEMGGEVEEIKRRHEGDFGRVAWFT